MANWRQHPTFRPTLWAVGVGVMFVALIASGPTLRAWTSSSSSSPTDTAAPTEEPEATIDVDLNNSFNALETTGKTGAVLVACGSDEMIQLGDVQSGYAWSTIKVPITIAAMKKPDPNLFDVTNTITTSDNQSATNLWWSLGDNTTAKSLVEAELAAGGNPDISVENRRFGDDQVAFGKTIWPLVDQARFALSLPTNPDANHVFNLMAEITPDQHFGFGSVSHPEMKFHFKVGWGPVDDRHTARQMAVLMHESGKYWSVAIISDSPGDLLSAQKDLDVLAAWVMEHMDKLRQPRC